MILRNIPGRTNWSRAGRCRLRGKGLKCVQIKVSSPSKMASTAWIRTSRGVTKSARQPSEFAPEMEGMDCGFFQVEEPQSPRPSQFIPSCAHGDRHRQVNRFCQALHRATDDPLRINCLRTSSYISMFTNICCSLSISQRVSLMSASMGILTASFSGSGTSTTSSVDCNCGISTVSC